MGLGVSPFLPGLDYYFFRIEQELFEELVFKGTSLIIPRSILTDNLVVSLMGVSGGRLRVSAVFPDGSEQDKGIMVSDEVWTLSMSPKPEYRDCWFKLVPVW